MGLLRWHQGNRKIEKKKVSDYHWLLQIRCFVGLKYRGHPYYADSGRLEILILVENGLIYDAPAFLYLQFEYVAFS